MKWKREGQYERERQADRERVRYTLREREKQIFLPRDNCIFLRIPSTCEHLRLVATKDSHLRRRDILAR